jgi:hypothetical protein
MQIRTLSGVIAPSLIALSIGATARAQAPAEPPPFAAPPPATQPPPPPPPEPAKKPAEDPVLGKWAPKLYGFVQLDAPVDTTQSFNDQPGNTTIAKPGTFAGEHSRFQMSAQHTRVGFKWATPGDGDFKVSANVETDFLGSLATGTTESVVFAQPILRMRLAYFKLETGVVDLLMGQYWELFGWQPYFQPNAVEIQGVPGEVYSRTPQIRLGHTFKGDAINFDIAIAGARPPQRDAGLPDLQAGLKLTANNWKGMRTSGAIGTATDAFSIGVSGALRWFKVANFAAKPTFDVNKNGWGISADAFVPIIPGTMEDRGNSLTLTGSFVIGQAIADFYSSLNGGITQPALPNPTMVTPAPTYTPNVDNGLVVFNSAGDLEPIKWWSTIIGLQYYLPPNGKVWIAGNYSHMHSSNIADVGNPANVFETSNWFDANLFWECYTSTRLGFEYAWYEQIYGDDVKAHNSRFLLSGFFQF